MLLCFVIIHIRYHIFVVISRLRDRRSTVNRKPRISPHFASNTLYILALKTLIRTFILIVCIYSAFCLPSPIIEDQVEILRYHVPETLRAPQ